MKLNYQSVKEFREIAQNATTEEWKYTSNAFKNTNQAIGILRNIHQVQIIQKENSDPVNLLSVSMEVSQNNFWTSENFHRIGKLTLTFQVENQRVRINCYYFGVYAVVVSFTLELISMF